GFEQHQQERILGPFSALALDCNLSAEVSLVKDFAQPLQACLRDQILQARIGIYALPIQSEFLSRAADRRPRADTNPERHRGTVKETNSFSGSLRTRQD